MESFLNYRLGDRGPCDSARENLITLLAHDRLDIDGFVLKPLEVVGHEMVLATSRTLNQHNSFVVSLL